MHRSCLLRSAAKKAECSGPLCTIAPINRFAESSETRWKRVDIPPTLSPNKDTAYRFPPKSPMLLCTHLRASHWCQVPWLPAISSLSRLRKSKMLSL